MEQTLRGTPTYKYYATEEQEKAKYKLYTATSKTTGKMYLGATEQNIIDRIMGHKNYAFSPSCIEKGSHFQSAIRKYGWEDFVWSIIETFETKEKMFEREIELIEELELIIKGYNTALGGEGLSHTEEMKEATRERFSVSCFSKNLWTGEIVEHRSRVEAGKATGVANSTVNHMVLGTGGVKTSGEYIYANTIEELNQKEEQLKQENHKTLPFSLVDKDYNIFPAKYGDEKKSGILTPENINKSSYEGFYTIQHHNLEEVIELLKKKDVYNVIYNMEDYTATAFKLGTEAAKFSGMSTEYFAKLTANGKISTHDYEKYIVFKDTLYNIENNITINTKNIEAVEQYDLEGNLIGIYTGLEQAWKVSGIKAKRYITRVVKGQVKQTNGFVFKKRLMSLQEFRDLRGKIEF